MSFGTDEILTHPDVLIIGTGAAGIAAAAGAYHSNASVTILEKNSYPGGKATAAFVGTICGLYYRSENAPEFVNKGFPMEFAIELANKSETTALQFDKGLHFLPYDHSEFVNLCELSIKKTTNSVVYHANVSGVEKENNRIISVTSFVENRKVKFYPKVVVDASGENLLSGYLGINYIESDNYQAAAQVFQLSGISETDHSVTKLSLIRSLQKGIEAGIISETFSGLSIVPGSLRNGNVLLKLPLPGIIDHKLLHRTALDLHARKLTVMVFKFLKVHCELFKKCSLTFIAPEAGIRTGPRNEGKYLLRADEVLSAKKNDAYISRGAWPVEFWEPGKKVRMDYFTMNDYYDIPAGALCSKNIANLFFGGRNISADDTAIASARVIGTCLATGYAAGSLAAGNANNIDEEISIQKIRNSLSI